LSRGQNRASCFNNSPIFIFFLLLLPLSNQSRGLATGNSSWMGPPLSFLLLNMKSEDIRQGPAVLARAGPPGTGLEWIFRSSIQATFLRFSAVHLQLWTCPLGVMDTSEAVVDGLQKSKPSAPLHLSKDQLAPAVRSNACHIHILKGGRGDGGSS
jgi:hypothetical protein